MNNTRDKDSRTPLYSAAVFDNAEMIKILIAASADINARAKGGFLRSGKTPLNVAILHGSSEAVKVLKAVGAK